MRRTDMSPPTRSTIQTVLRFGVVGVLNTALDFAVFLLLTKKIGMHPAIANVISYCVGLTNSFICNKLWTFGAVAQRTHVGKQFAVFAALNLAGLAISTTIVAALQFIGPATAKLISIPFVFAWNYWTSRRFVYRG